MCFVAVGPGSFRAGMCCLAAGGPSVYRPGGGEPIRCYEVWGRNMANGCESMLMVVANLIVDSDG